MVVGGFAVFVGKGWGGGGGGGGGILFYSTAVDWSWESLTKTQRKDGHVLEMVAKTECTFSSIRWRDRPP